MDFILYYSIYVKEESSNKHEVTALELSVCKKLLNNHKKNAIY